MKLICKNDITEVYEDNGFWVSKWKGNEKRIDRNKWPAFPLACVLKWGMEAVDMEFLVNLDKELYGDDEED